MHDDFSEKLIIQLAPTGMVPTKKDTPYVPITPREIARDIYKAYKLGVSVVHIHARDEEGRPTYKKEIYEDIFSLVKEKCPDIIICASTSGRVFSRLDQRTQVLDLGPDMASLTVGSLNFPADTSVNSIETIKELATRMARRGIKPELEIFEAGFINTAKYLAGKGYFKPPLHFNLLLGSLGSIPADMRDHVYLVESIPRGDTWSATGIGRFQARINVAAILMGGHVRVGIEDSIYYDHKNRELATNERLVKRIVKITKELGREIATPAEARKILRLKDSN
jgi:3-keto-5-aminohexanoate cleavage enzyme